MIAVGNADFPPIKITEHINTSTTSDFLDPDPYDHQVCAKSATKRGRKRERKSKSQHFLSAETAGIQDNSLVKRERPDKRRRILTYMTAVRSQYTPPHP